MMKGTLLGVLLTKKLIRWYCEQLYAKVFHNLKQQHKFLGKAIILSDIRNKNFDESNIY